MTFKYQDKIITTPNLEKKLKRMKISLEDIEIIPEIPRVNKEENGVDNEDKEMVIVKSSLDNLQRVCYVPIGTRPPLLELFKNQIWNGQTGIKGLTEDFIKTMYYEEK